MNIKIVQKVFTEIWKAVHYFETLDEAQRAWDINPGLTGFTFDRDYEHIEDVILYEGQSCIKYDVGDEISFGEEIFVIRKVHIIVGDCVVYHVDDKIVNTERSKESHKKMREKSDLHHKHVQEVKKVNGW